MADQGSGIADVDVATDLIVLLDQASKEPQGDIPDPMQVETNSADEGLNAPQTQTAQTSIDHPQDTGITDPAESNQRPPLAKPLEHVQDEAASSSAGIENATGAKARPPVPSTKGPIAAPPRTRKKLEPSTSSQTQQMRPLLKQIRASRHTTFSSSDSRSANEDGWGFGPDSDGDIDDNPPADTDDGRNAKIQRQGDKQDVTSGRSSDAEYPPEYYEGKNWIRRFEVKQQRPHYFNRVTKHVQWVLPLPDQVTVAQLISEAAGPANPDFDTLQTYWDPIVAEPKSWQFETEVSGSTKAFKDLVDSDAAGTDYHVSRSCGVTRKEKYVTVPDGYEWLTHLFSEAIAFGGGNTKIEPPFLGRLGREPYGRMYAIIWPLKGTAKPSARALQVTYSYPGRGDGFYHATKPGAVLNIIATKNFKKFAGDYSEEGHPDAICAGVTPKADLSKVGLVLRAFGVFNKYDTLKSKFASTCYDWRAQYLTQGGKHITSFPQVYLQPNSTQTTGIYILIDEGIVQLARTAASTTQDT